MNGAQSLIKTLVNCGVDTCFANPGTSEMHFVAALDSTPEMRPILCLFEGVATGAADGYGRIAGRPAATLLHLGPGLANGLANLHNARRAATPIVNVVGEHAIPHLQYDAPLTSDIEGFARPVSSWVHTATSSRSVATDAARAVQAARAAPGAIATLILPADTAWGPAARGAAPLADIGPSPVSVESISQCARALKTGRRTALLLRGPALRGHGLETAGRIAARTGARLLCDTFAPHTELGAGRVPLQRIPYFGEQIVEFLRDLQQIILVASSPPVSFFSYPGKPSWCAPAGCEFLSLCEPHEDGTAALQALADEVGAAATGAHNPLELPALPYGALSAETAAQIIVAMTPEHAIYADESATSGAALHRLMRNGRPCTHLPLTGGSIGQALPVAVGAAVAAPGRKVICPHGDGGAAYTLQALWTMAREKLDVTVVIYSNHAYAILSIELQRVGANKSGPRALSMLDLHNPELNWTQIASGLGVDAARASTCEEFAALYSSAINQRGPRLIEAML